MDELLAGALKWNWRGWSAMELHQLTREVLAGKSKRYKSHFEVPNPRLLNLWEEKVASRR